MKKTVLTFAQAKTEGRKISMLTAYDYSMARLVDAVGVDSILVGDSLGNVILGYQSTTSVTMEDMIHHGAAVVRGAKEAFVIVDMPFMSYQTSVYDAVKNAGRIIAETGASAVKLEGGVTAAPAIEAIVNAGIPVCAHLGLTPQSVNAFGGHKVQGKDSDAAQKILQDAKAVEDAGAFAVVLECIPAALAAFITEHLSIPTIGIGAGPECDGQVQVYPDLLGMFNDFVPRHAGRFAEAGEVMTNAFRDYVAAVEAGEFPTAKNSFSMDEDTADSLVWRAEELGGLTEFEVDTDWDDYSA